MKVVLFSLLTLVAFALPSGASTNRIESVASVSSPAMNTNDMVEADFLKIMESDDAAADEIDGWILENQKFADLGAGLPRDELNRRIRKRLGSVRAAYDDFIKRNPNHARARLAYASFLEDNHEENAALEQMLKAKDIDPANPAAWNNLANFFGHNGPVTNAFAHYEQAIKLAPHESVYYHNFGNTVFLYRKDAMDYYGIGEQQVFDKALTLYSNSLHLDPTNFLLATDIAMTYYGIRPPRTDDALKAWDYALKLADGSLQREGVLIHLARMKMNAGNFTEARAHLNAVTNIGLAELKARVLRNLEAKEHSVSDPASNALPAIVSPTNKVPANPQP